MAVVGLPSRLVYSLSLSLVPSLSIGVGYPRPLPVPWWRCFRGGCSCIPAALSSDAPADGSIRRIGRRQAC